MTLAESLLLFFIAFVVVPISVETSVCVCPGPGKKGAVCDWESKTWNKKFDIKTKEYYYVLSEADETDNRIEKQMRKRYHEKRREEDENTN